MYTDARLESAQAKALALWKEFLAATDEYVRGACFDSGARLRKLNRAYHNARDNVKANIERCYAIEHKATTKA